MHTIGKALHLYAASLLLSSLLSAGSPGMEMVLLVDITQLSVSDNARVAQDPPRLAIRREARP